ncbi:hypothetical protein DPMN_103635 [Dreissena polymorpha]|uniref:Uncharacterized protein n=1 Tax=Dreissena polymorpha TaxID=45954 RepID=A0A9D4K2F6_DREPO|nr:hypothetical protein DPMN_103635 [Dreissena polymorpha]
MTKVKVLGQTHTYKNRQTDRPKTNIPPIIRSGCIQIIPVANNVFQLLPNNKGLTTEDFIKINILTKLHKDWMKTVTSTVYTNKMLTDTRKHIRMPDITRSHKLTMSLCDR